MKAFSYFLGLWIALAAHSAPPVVTVPDIQPLRHQVGRLIDALEMTGAPVTSEERGALDAALAEPHAELAAARIQSVLDRRVLASIHINPEMRVRVTSTMSQPQLMEGGWRSYLIKVHNESGTTAELRLESPQAGRLHNAPASAIEDRWLAADMFGGAPMRKELSGYTLEYRILQLYSRDAGMREAKLSFNVGQGTQDLGFRSEADVLFVCEPSREVKLRIQDESGEPTTGALWIRDGVGRIYPAPAKRLAPDFFFHPQVYRADGEFLRLPDGDYRIAFQRGPESIREVRSVKVNDALTEVAFKVQRWIDPARHGWISGDHHIHAAGCAHYSNPTDGVHAADMMRHVVGEDLKIGANLTWGPGFDYQKQFFLGVDDPVSRWPYVLRYDVEVSGFGSHESGHLCLLQLKEQIFPGGDSKNHWPKLGLNTLRWAKRQGALVGPAHSGWGLEVASNELPNYEIPPFNGIGANEYIMDVTHEVPGPDGALVPAVDFLSTVDTPHLWELNIWYHTLNAGFRTRISGETDFPCIFGERVGLGRSYVHLDGDWSYEDWCEGIRAGRNYVSDGFSHLMDFQGEGVRMGENGSEIRLSKAGTITFSARVAARLDEEPNHEIRGKRQQDQPYWHIERARTGDSREVPVELIRNGVPVASQQIRADGTEHEVRFTVEVDRSSWYALRIRPSSHTNPLFVLVEDRPIRASRRSIQWCIDSLEQCWRQKERFYKGAEHAQAVADYAHAREVYRKLLAECEIE